jgi:redox-sensitive bicupin YhaK (pirin superfamily)
LEPNRLAWLQVADGRLALDGMKLGTGDGVALSGVTALSLAAETRSQVLLFDMV